MSPTVDFLAQVFVAIQALGLAGWRVRSAAISIRILRAPDLTKVWFAALPTEMRDSLPHSVGRADAVGIWLEDSDSTIEIVVACDGKRISLRNQLASQILGEQRDRSGQTNGRIATWIGPNDPLFESR